jgi:hypothetical protein
VGPHGRVGVWALTYPSAYRSLALLAIAATPFLGINACNDNTQARTLAVGDRLHRARIALAASFVGGQAAGLRERIHHEMIIQPPEPDSALRGRAAAVYLERLARTTEVRHSELLPRAVSEEGEFLLEHGTWLLQSDQVYRSRYTIRWRESSSGWQVVLWRWTLFQ